MSARFQSVTRCARIIGLIAISTVLTSCSAVKLGYNNTPDLAYWWLDSYVDFTESQTLKVREELTRLHRWHRTTELPKLAELLRKMQRAAPGDVTPEQVCSLYADVRTRVEALNAQAEPATVALATSLKPSQLVHLAAKLKKNNEEWHEKWRSGGPAERQARRLKASVERAEQLYDTIGEAQRKILQTAAATSSFDSDAGFTERQRRQQDLLQTLRQISDARATQATTSAAESQQAPTQPLMALRSYVDRTINSPDPVYRAQSDKALQEGCRTAAQVHNSTNAQQRTAAVERLAAYERDLNELATQR